MTACDPAQPPSSVANDLLTASSSPSSALQSNPYDIDARTPKGIRSQELNLPFGCGQQPEIPGVPPAPPPAPGPPQTARLVLEERLDPYEIHPALLEESPLPLDAPTPRPPHRAHPFDPIDDALASQGYPPRSSRPMACHGSATPWDGFSDEDGVGGPIEGDESDEEEDEVLRHLDRRSFSLANSESDGGNLGHGSGTRTNRQWSLSSLSVDEPEPAHQPIEQAKQQPAPLHSPPRQVQAEAHYPAYDESGRRIGLEHTRSLQSQPQAARSYYRPRTHNYPGPNVKTTDLPHMRTLDMRIPPSAIAPTGPSRFMMLRSPLQPSPALQSQFKAPLLPNAPATSGAYNADLRSNPAHSEIRDRVAIAGRGGKRKRK